MKGFAYIFKPESYQYAIILAAAVLPGCIFSVYALIYFLLPFFQRKKYLPFIAGIPVVLVLDCAIELYFYLFTRPYTCIDCGENTLREKINITAAWGINIAFVWGAIAMSIKFTKSWYLQQAHNRTLVRKKTTNELKLLKARIQPDFLFESLQALYKKTASNKNEAGEMLLRFSELLSYTLYECDADFVRVDREVFIINEFFALEKLVQKKQIGFSENIADGLSSKFIPSFILLSFIQGCSINFYNTIQEAQYLNIKLYGEDDALYCVMNMQQVSASDFRNKYLPIINTYINRLETFYENSYTLGFAEEEKGRFIITMSLLVSANFPKEKINNTIEPAYAFGHI